MSKPQWKTTNQTIVSKNPYWRYLKDDIESASGAKGEYHFIQTLGSVLIVPRVGLDLYVMVRQYRYIQKKFSIEFPGGGIDDGESNLEAAHRELLEETGFHGENPKEIGSFSPCLGLVDEHCHVYLMDAKEGNKPQEGEWEKMNTIILSHSEIETRIANGEIWSGMALSAWMLAQRAQKKDYGWV